MTFDSQPILTGELLTLRPLEVNDFQNLYQVAKDPLIWELHPVKDRYKQLVFQSFFQDSVNSKGTLVAIDNQSEQIIGSSRYHGYDPKKSEIEIGWSFLARSYWGGTYNREMKDLMLRHAFKYVHTVVLIVGKANLRSQRAVEKIGGVFKGYQPDTSGNDSLLYHIDKSQYLGED